MQMGVTLREWVAGVVIGALTAVASAAEGPASAAAPDAPSSASKITAPNLTLEPGEGPDSIDAWLQTAKERPAGLLPYGPVSLFDPLWVRLGAEWSTVEWIVV